MAFSSDKSVEHSVILATALGIYFLMRSYTCFCGNRFT